MYVPLPTEDLYIFDAYTSQQGIMNTGATTSIFRAVERSKIFKDKRYLSKGYNPKSLEEIKHRDSEIRSYISILSAAMQGYVPENVFIYGQTGIGKSLTTKLVTARLEQDGIKNNIPIKVVYLNCDSIRTDFGLIKALNSIMSPESLMNKFVNSFDAYFIEFCRIINSSDFIPIIIFDEIDKLVNPDVINVFARVKENGQVNRNICLIGITNDILFAQNLEARTKSILTQRSILFSPYDANQLRDILYQRAKEAFHENVLSETVIPICAAFAAQIHGDARKAIEMLQITGEIAEQEGSCNVEEKHIQKAREQVEFNEVCGIIRVMPIQSKFVLASCAILNFQGKRKMLISEIFDEYKKIVDKIGFSSLTLRRVTDIIQTLEVFGILSGVLIYKGRHGRIKEIFMNVDHEIVWSVILEDRIFAPFDALQVKKDVIKNLDSY